MQTVIHKIDKQQRVTVNAGNYIQYLIKTYNGKNLKYIYVNHFAIHLKVIDSLILLVNYISIKKV